MAGKIEAKRQLSTVERVQSEQYQDLRIIERRIQRHHNKGEDVPLHLEELKRGIMLEIYQERSRVEAEAEGS